MEKAIKIAEYFLSKDPERKLFTKDLVEKNGRIFYAGNARLNKYLHMSQNVYIAKTGGKLFEEDLYAYDNGAVVVNVQESYGILWNRKSVPQFNQDICEFLDKIYKILQNAPIEELIEISHEDSEWIQKHDRHLKNEQRMDSLSHTKEYQIQYADVLEIMERMGK